MKLSHRVGLITAVITIPAFLLGRIIWPDAPGLSTPTAGEMPFYIFLAFIEALLLGLGISFLIFEWNSVRKAADTLTWWTYCAVGWAMVSWWPHDNFHRWNGENTHGLLFIEYGFHLTLIIGALIVTKYFLREFHSRS